MPWQPMKKIPDEAMNAHYLAIHAEGDANVEVWMNDRYEVTIREAKEGPAMRHLSVNTHDRGPVRNWRHLQQIKNEVCGELWTGVEFFPPENKLTDTANQYHLFCFPPEIDFGFGLGGPDQALVTDDDRVESWNDAPHKGFQEPWEDGLTTGRTDASKESRERLNAYIDKGLPVKPSPK